MKPDSNDTVGVAAQEQLVRQSFPDYGVNVWATTITGETGVWSHGQYGWYPDGMWGGSEYPHDHIATWKSLPNASG